VSNSRAEIKKLVIVARSESNIFCDQLNGRDLPYTLVTDKQQLLKGEILGFDGILVVNEGAVVGQAFKQKFPDCQVLICRGSEKDFSPEVLAVQADGQIDSWYYASWDEFIGLVKKRLPSQMRWLEKKPGSETKEGLFVPVGELAAFDESPRRAKTLFREQLDITLAYHKWLEDWLSEVNRKNFSCRFQFPRKDGKLKGSVRRLTVKVTPEFVYQGMPIFSAEDIVVFGGDDQVEGVVETIDEESMVIFLKEKITRKLAESFRAYSRQINQKVVTRQHQACQALLDSLIRETDDKTVLPLQVILGNSPNFGFPALDELQLHVDEQGLLRDPAQVMAVRQVIGGRRVCFIEGPGGSGKTFVTSIALKQLWRSFTGLNFLVVSHSNQGLDVLIKGIAKSVGQNEVIFRLGNNGDTVTPAGVPFHRTNRFPLPAKYESEDNGNGTDSKDRTVTADFQRFQQKLHDDSDFLLKRFPEHAQTIKATAKGDPQVIMEVSQIVRQKDKGKSVILGITMSSFMIDRTLELLNLLWRGFTSTVTVIDEATRGFLHELLPIFLKTEDKIVFVGDHRQLGNIRLPDFVRKLLREHHDEPSVVRFQDGLFASLIMTKSFSSTLLNRSRRSLPIICRLVSHLFYEDLLGAARFNLEFPGRIAFYDTSKAKDGKETKQGTSYYNSREANLVVNEVLRCIKRLTTEKKLSYAEAFKRIGIITPYKAQIEQIKERLREKLGFVLKITDQELIKQAYEMIGTVDAYQGSEREIIILSFVRSNPHGNIGFNEDLRRLTVALSRAKDELVIIGSKQTFLKSGIPWVEKVFTTLVDYIKQLQTEGLADNAVYQLLE
jgi:hypothetical protein